MDQNDLQLRSTSLSPHPENIAGEVKETASQSSPLNLSIEDEAKDSHFQTTSFVTDNDNPVQNMKDFEVFSETHFDLKGKPVPECSESDNTLNVSHHLPHTDSSSDICNSENNSICVTSQNMDTESGISDIMNKQEEHAPQGIISTGDESLPQTVIKNPHECFVEENFNESTTPGHQTESGSQQGVPSHDVLISSADVMPSITTSFTLQENKFVPQESSNVPLYPPSEVGHTDTDYNVDSLTATDPRDDSRYILSSVSSMGCLATASTCFQQQDGGNFLKGCKWSPDGNQIMTNSNDSHLRIFTPEKQITLPSNVSLDPSCVIYEKSQVYDYCWYPGMSLSSPETCRVVCSCSNIPIHLWDSSYGEHLATYAAYDHCDEITAAYSLSFSPDGSKLFAGYKKSIRIFDTARPGRMCKLLKTFDTKTKEGIRGIISCFAFSQDASPIFVAGSYSRDVGIYDYASQQLIYMMQGQQGGVTHVMLSPDGTKLYTGGRKDPEIVCWDMRNTGQVLFTCLRDVQTNQRIYFDLSESGQYLVSGNHDGSVVLWNTLDSGEIINGEVIIKPCLSFLAHQDCVNGVSFNHNQGLLATASGQRHFMDFDDYDSDGSSMSVDNEDKAAFDCSLKLWKIPCHTGDT